MKVKWRKATSQEIEAFEFLNELRDSGVTNMFGATPYIERELGHGRAESMKLLALWMKVYNEQGDYETIPV